MGQQIDYEKHCKLDSGEYVGVQDKPSLTNGMPSFTIQGSYKFIDLNTGEKLKKRALACIPIPYFLITKLERLAEKEKCNSR